MTGLNQPAPIAESFVAPDHWRAIDLLSDVHLQLEMPRTFDAWRAQMLSSDADAVFILGDLFELWLGDDARAGAFEGRCLAVVRECAALRTVAFMPGNRDFLLSAALLSEHGVRRLNDPTLLDAWGQRLLLTHGDALCLDDVDYQRFRAQVRGADWQRDFLARPLAERRTIARAMRDASTAHQARRSRSASVADYGEIDAQAALAWLGRTGATTLIHGHTHRPGSSALDSVHRRWVLGDWDFDGATPRAFTLRLTRQGVAAVHPAPASTT